MRSDAYENKDAASLAEKAVASVATEAESMARTQAENLRSSGVEEAERTSDALESAANSFDPQSLQAAALGHLADTVTSMTSQLRDKPLDALVDDVALFARQNPALFLGGALLCGFAAARFLKAPSPTPSVDDPWTGHLHAPTPVATAPAPSPAETIPAAPTPETKSAFPASRAAQMEVPS